MQVDVLELANKGFSSKVSMTLLQWRLTKPSPNVQIKTDILTVEKLVRVMV